MTAGPAAVTERKRGAAPALQGLEKILVENWIGVLGALIMVAGAGFLSIYAAIRFESLSRFLMLVAFSLVLFGISFLLQRYPVWEKLASGCAAVPAVFFCWPVSARGIFLVCKG
jgi:predicted phage tail protein